MQESLTPIFDSIAPLQFSHNDGFFRYASSAKRRLLSFDTIAATDFFGYLGFSNRIVIKNQKATIFWWPGFPASRSTSHRREDQGHRDTNAIILSHPFHRYRSDLRHDVSIYANYPRIVKDKIESPSKSSCTRSNGKTRRGKHA
jgi:hypothetical protein